jgi:hypothetical protein
MVNRACFFFRQHHPPPHLNTSAVSTWNFSRRKKRLYPPSGRLDSLVPRFRTTSSRPKPPLPHCTTTTTTTITTTSSSSSTIITAVPTATDPTTKRLRFRSGAVLLIRSLLPDNFCAGPRRLPPPNSSAVRPWDCSTFSACCCGGRSHSHFHGRPKSLSQQQSSNPPLISTIPRQTRDHRRRPAADQSLSGRQPS